MATTIPDLWSDDIKVEVLPPIAVLKAQEGSLARRTQGMLQAKVTTTETDKLVQHQLDLIAPSLNFYRERLLSATHDRTQLYPVTVSSEAFVPLPELNPRPTELVGGVLEPLRKSVASMARAHAELVGSIPPQPPPVNKRAVTDEELIQLVREVLQSDRVRALISSLIARINAGNGQQTNGATGSDEKPAS